MNHYDFKKGMKVKIFGGNDIWTICDDVQDDDISIRNKEYVVVSCDYARLVPIPEQEIKITESQFDEAWEKYKNVPYKMGEDWKHTLKGFLGFKD